MKQILSALVLLLAMVARPTLGQWVIAPNDSITHYQQVKFIDSLHGYIAGGGILSTTDAGISWHQVNTGENSILRSLCSKDGLLWASTDYGKVYLSKDSGKTLNLEFTDKTPYDFHAISFVDSLRGWLFGSAWGTSPSGEIILHTIDGGKTWSAEYELDQPPSIPGELYQGFFVDSLHGWAARQYYMLHTFNGGNDWIGQSVPGAPDLYSVFFIDTSRGWAVGDDGTYSYLILTTDGGQNWVRGNTGISSTVRSVFFVDSSSGWISCADGTIAHSTDGGQNWKIQQSNTKSSLESIFFVNKQNGWAVGDKGVILHTTNGGSITEVPPTNESPVAFSLSQNFPNPFNPTTRIQYSIATKSYVEIKVYNLLGQSVITLVHDWEETGSYSVNFDGTELSSGVYICKLSAHDTHGMSSVELKKMTLLH